MKRTVLGGYLFSILCLSAVLHAEDPKDQSTEPVNEFISLKAEAPEKLSQLEPKWHEFALGGETSCSRGTPFSFFVHPASNPDSKKVVIDYMGGGACWDSENCAPGTKTFLESIEEFKKDHASELNGVYDHKNPANPLNDWTHIIVPYCTGDIHWGDNDQTYTKRNRKSFKIRHRGAVNSKAVLDWVKKEIAAPEKVLVTGCSAGAYGSIYWYPHVREMYPQAMVRQLSDSGISPITESFAKVAFKEWNVEKNRPQWIPSLDPKVQDWTKLQIDFLYKTLGGFYPNDKVAAFTSAFDSTQRGFYWMMGGDVGEWPGITKNNLSAIAASTPQFNYFVTPGENHCILPWKAFYTSKASSGEYFKDWFKTYIEGGSVANVACPNCTDADQAADEYAMDDEL